VHLQQEDNSTMMESLSEVFPRPHHPGPHYNPMFSHMMGKFWGLISPPNAAGMLHAASHNAMLSPPNPTILSPPRSEGGQEEHHHSG
jgi:hypothetical protein